MVDTSFYIFLTSEFSVSYSNTGPFAFDATEGFSFADLAQTSNEFAFGSKGRLFCITIKKCCGFIWLFADMGNPVSIFCHECFVFKQTPNSPGQMLELQCLAKPQSPKIMEKGREVMMKTPQTT